MSKMKDHPMSRETEAVYYLEKHKINELFANITSFLVFNKPENPKTAIIDYLESLKRSKITHGNPPSLFEDANLQSIFGMLDTSGKGSITYKQYTEALKTLGIVDFELNPPGKKEDAVKFDVFSKEAKKGLHKIHSTYCP